MKRIRFFIIAFIAVAYSCLQVSCREDKIDGESIFDISIPEYNSFDVWLDENYIKTYNIQLQYKMKDIETPNNYDMVPPRIDAAKKMAVVIKHMFLEPYDEVVGVHFARSYAPRIFTLVGDGDAARGTAEGGLKVVLYYINDIVFEYQHLAGNSYFKTLHHEFQHILNQVADFPPEYKRISDGQYIGADYKSKGESAALQAGFISPYGMSEVGEDIAELYAWYLVLSESDWNARIALAGEIGAPILESKLDILKNYMMSSFGVDMDKLRSINYRRMNEIDMLDLDNLDF